ncbi:glycosyltransferase family 2 protein [Microbacterium sp. BK668]|uniref:glycosyltransferase family 2 protein n=1 Tax=Microbacterium sp. BK668 TaxID=2512118 RepID=UPI00105E0D6E|nr:glycosyltransferase family 2 protein [Microbacterium sp. BK668]TDN90545.1 glycosyltransferase involved in cell wall biosynthesis [Microbacterium sp. BK668]
MTDLERITVVLPCYNAAEFAESAIDRLLGQEGVDLEIVAVDDASTDGTARLLTELAARHECVRAILLERNGGVAAAREAGVTAATGTYVWFVDADDDWPPDALRSMVGVAAATNADIVCAGATVTAEGHADKPVGEVPDQPLLTGAEALRSLLVGDITGHLWNKLFRRDLLEKITFTRIRQHSDQAMVAQALVEARRVATLQRSVYTYRLRVGSIIRSGAKRADSLRELGEVIESCVSRVDKRALRGVDYLYYRARYSVLSRLKDATSGAYDPPERSALLKEIRGEMSMRQLAALARRRDSRRLAIYTIGWISPRGYGAVLDRAGGRL